MIHLLLVISFRLIRQIQDIVSLFIHSIRVLDLFHLVVQDGPLTRQFPNGFILHLHNGRDMNIFLFGSFRIVQLLLKSRNVTFEVLQSMFHIF